MTDQPGTPSDIPIPEAPVTVPDIGYGTQFDGWYDDIFPKDGAADAIAERLAAWHPDTAVGTCELGVGTGRVALPLSTRVGEVIGVDSSPEMLAGLAREPDSERVVPVHADIRTWSAERRFGLVYAVCATLSMLTSPEDQRSAVARAAEALAPGGLLVIETHHKAAILALHEGRRRVNFFVPYPKPDSGLATYSTLLPDDLWHCSHIWYGQERPRIGSELSRLTSPEEIDEYARQAGLTPEERYGSWDGDAHREESPMIIATYRHGTE